MNTSGYFTNNSLQFGNTTQLGNTYTMTSHTERLGITSTLKESAQDLEVNIDQYRLHWSI